MTTLEGGIRVPFMVQWKGKLPAGKTYDEPVIQLDILPTAVAAAGGTIEPSAKLDGVDIMPYLTGEKSGRPHERLYWRLGPQWAVRHGDWKLVENRIDGEGARLFNLANDIGEATDLAKAEPKKVAELQALYDAWDAEQEEPRWLPNPAGGKKKGAAKKAAAKKKAAN
jgi:arylsulfatase A-like enzyme